MRIIAFSDSHGNYRGLEEIYISQPNADVYIHLGDGYEQARRLKRRCPLMPILVVKGNCDFGETDSDYKQFELSNKKIIYTHGHRFDVKSGMGAIKQEAKQVGADIVLFGHTHLPFNEKIDDVYYINPGSLSSINGIRFAIIDIDDQGEIQVCLAELKH